ncbi:membrane protein [Pseudoclavibacter endophyticus]|uniref:DUF456 domain-containing protein n=1 Tax=Pseudoclavibacter endophyticus TaxID=1778590 RepID=A0A6H9WSY7_9MICO|nr:DUF456 domain-containing protein [Pseudoclavibacter endophyticus]KAB1650047.1 DUF456 domain-containing protein [Pseudoclavibacter endophyticus]GGA57689.1 membrane protein [Pseudoclavibacter endophyticus]
MAPDVIAAIVAGILAIVGVLGIILPVLPGSITVLIGLLVWAIWGGSGWAWAAFAIGGVPVLIGMISGWVLAKRGLDKRKIPNWPVLVAAGAGIVGLFVIPLLGLPIGFIVGLVVAEYFRLGDWKQALDTSWVAMKSLGLGMLIELACAFFAFMVLAISILVHFATGA